MVLLTLSQEHALRCACGGDGAAERTASRDAALEALAVRQEGLAASALVASALVAQSHSSISAVRMEEKAVAVSSATGSAESAVAADGDFVILWGSYTQIQGVVLQHGAITNNRFGSFHHDDLIGQPFGAKVRPRKGGGWLALLRATPELISLSLSHRTQIIYHADISMLLMLLDAQPGRVICEAGTGSGSMSCSLARALCPGGKLHTFEFHADRQRQANEDFARYGLLDTIESRHGDVCTDGFGAELDGAVDGIFLDVPMPWLAVPHAYRCLVEGGKICTFSPCIEQIEKTAAELRRDGRFENVRMFESLAVNWGVKEGAPPRKRQRVAVAGSGTGGAEGAGEGAGGSGGAIEAANAAEAPSWLSIQMPMKSHTSYLLVATRALQDPSEALASLAPTEASTREGAEAQEGEVIAAVTDGK